MLAIFQLFNSLIGELSFGIHMVYHVYVNLVRFKGAQGHTNKIISFADKRL